MKAGLALLFALPILVGACSGADPAASTPTQAPVDVTITPPATALHESKQVAKVAAPLPAPPVALETSPPGDDGQIAVLRASGETSSDTAGLGGLGLRGTGGGGRGEGIGLGSLGTLGHGAGQAFGSGRGQLGGGDGSAPSVRQGATQVTGRLPPEVIQRIVRQNFGRFRLCYENGLRARADLEGRVTLKMVIDKTGAVSAVSDGGSDLPDPAVKACVLQVGSTLAFPEPEGGGVVVVLYPLVFKPGDPPAAQPAPGKGAPAAPPSKP